MIMKRIASHIVATLAVILTISVLAGCSSATSAVAKPKCDQSPVLGKATPTVAILAQTGLSAVAYTNDVSTVLQGATTMGARVLVNGVDDGTGTPTLLTNVVMTGDGINALSRTSNLTCKTASVGAAMTTLRSRPAPSKVNDFAAFMTLEGNLSGSHSSGPVDVVLLTSLTNTASPIDLSNPAQLADPVHALNTLADNRLIPNCKNWRFHAVDANPSSAAGIDGQLREFWRQFAKRCGGKLVAWTTHVTTFPGDGRALTASDIKKIATTQTANVIEAVLTGDVLFDPGSPTLRGGAADQLDQLLALARSTSGTINITGFTDVGGSESSNITLSRSRAAGVGDWLAGHGVSLARITTGGNGSANALYPNPISATEHQANRRVIVRLDSK
jgi:outer membrane protein OmpA-like peptidoglycan-associated protein